MTGVFLSQMKCDRLCPDFCRNAKLCFENGKVSSDPYVHRTHSKGFWKHIYFVRIIKVSGVQCCFPRPLKTKTVKTFFKWPIYVFRRQKSVTKIWRFFLFCLTQFFGISIWHNLRPHTYIVSWAYCHRLLEKVNKRCTLHTKAPD